MENKYWLSDYQWYRKWYGGRWEYHDITICHAQMWLEMRQDKCWPEYIQPCSLGVPIIEDYPVHKET